MEEGGEGVGGRFGEVGLLDALVWVGRLASMAVRESGGRSGLSADVRLVGIVTGVGGFVRVVAVAARGRVG